MTAVTHSKYTSYPFQLLQLPISVTPVTLSSIPVANSSYYSYTSYHFQLHQLPSPVTQTSYFSYVLQVLQLPIPVTQDTQSSCPSYPSEQSELRYRGVGVGKRRCDSVNSSELDELTAKLIVGLASGALPPRLVKFSDLEVG